jgi:hypothetical protein
MKIVKVEWVDIHKEINDNTFSENEDIDDKVAKIETIGWLYRETKKSVFLVQEFWNKTVRDWIIIPKSVITKITIIRK